MDEREEFYGRLTSDENSKTRVAKERANEIRKKNRNTLFRKQMSKRRQGQNAGKRQRTEQLSETALEKLVEERKKATRNKRWTIKIYLEITRKINFNCRRSRKISV